MRLTTAFALGLSGLQLVSALPADPREAIGQPTANSDRVLAILLQAIESNEQSVSSSAARARQTGVFRGAAAIETQKEKTTSVAEAASTSSKEAKKAEITSAGQTVHVVAGKGSNFGDAFGGLLQPFFISGLQSTDSTTTSESTLISENTDTSSTSESTSSAQGENTQGVGAAIILTSSTATSEVSSSSSTSTSAESQGVNAKGVGAAILTSSSTNAQAAASTSLTNAAATETAASNAGASSSSSVEAPVGTAAAAEASSSVFQLPGRQLAVLPIGLGIFAGISVIALVIVGVVTYERRKYRRQYRARKMREQVSSAGGFRDMNEVRV